MQKTPNLSSDDISDKDIVESDVEVDNTDVVDPDYDPPQKVGNRRNYVDEYDAAACFNLKQNHFYFFPLQMGDPSIEVTEENRDAAQISKSQAMDSISGGKLSVSCCSNIADLAIGRATTSVCVTGKLQEAIGHLTEAIMLNPSSAILVYTKLNKPNAAMRDADAALQINPDSAKGFKVRGMARAMLGQWEEAASDLRVASKLDYDEEIGVALKKVEPNAHKIEEHRRKYERLRKERELRKIERERQRRHAEAKGQEAVSALKDGQVIGIPSAGELEKMLNAASRSSRLAVLYFTATWCGPCRMISPLYTSLAAKYPKVVFLKVDIDEARDAAARWTVSSVPTFFFIRNGKEIDKVVGADKGSLEKKISLYAGQPDSIVGGKEETDYEDVEIQELIGGFDLKTVDVFKREDRLRATTAKTILRDRKSFEVRTKLHTSQSHGFTNLDPCSCSASTSVQNLHKTRM
ncbi:hypothetical protein RHGRI_023899 [Rhododendron griersonianum]|uniref:Thioredoxin domain-containing protein n=1 Tax=Rhododendron griersonianum TaxID=479676 RepID=A0AAV6J6G7_9ERIC|nr:hypothetical protein RHGRI_023899 [Rhododendron griersonianum]